ncbi:hypothetical protein [Clostridium sp.]|uniref:hypothetical protein n=1 Tax=Clostridium sp. TaxID=1506 RepID=UPI0025828800|nr:hypothetical protein [Clostridium sp.]MDF2505094.1 hypothetical protein [Clostridium sp.]
MMFIKNNRKLHKVFMTLFIGAIIFSACSSIQIEEQTTMHNSIIDNIKLINAMFPEQQFVKQGKYYSAGERENYYIESIIPGSFINKDNDELLVVVRRLSNELSHVGGFYNAYMAVFDNPSGKIISEVKLFSVDEGNYRIFDSQGISYIFFAGSTTYQGWSNWYGGLWQAGIRWTMKWPKDFENQEYYDYWENRAVEISEDVIKILQRKVLPLKYKDQVMPDYTWEYVEELQWDKESGSFKLME